MQRVPPAAAGNGTAVLASTDLGAAFVPVTTTYGRPTGTQPPLLPSHT